MAKMTVVSTSSSAKNVFVLYEHHQIRVRRRRFIGGGGGGMCVKKHTHTHTHVWYYSISITRFEIRYLQLVEEKDEDAAFLWRGCRGPPSSSKHDRARLYIGKNGDKRVHFSTVIGGEISTVKGSAFGRLLEILNYCLGKRKPGNSSFRARLEIPSTQKESTPGKESR